MTTLVGSWHAGGKDYACYGDGSRAEYCEIDLRTPVLKELQAWIKSSGIPHKVIAETVGLSTWAIKGIARGNTQVPTTTLYEVKALLIKGS